MASICVHSNGMYVPASPPSPRHVCLRISLPLPCGGVCGSGRGRNVCTSVCLQQKMSERACMYVCMCVCIRMCVCLCVCVYVWNIWIDVKLLLHSSATFWLLFQFKTQGGAAWLWDRTQRSYHNHGILGLINPAYLHLPFQFLSWDVANPRTTLPNSTTCFFQSSLIDELQSISELIALQSYQFGQVSCLVLHERYIPCQ